MNCSKASEHLLLRFERKSATSFVSVSVLNTCGCAVAAAHPQRSTVNQTVCVWVATCRLFSPNLKVLIFLQVALLSSSFQPWWFGCRLNYFFFCAALINDKGEREENEHVYLFILMRHRLLLLLEWYWIENIQIGIFLI